MNLLSIILLSILCGTSPKQSSQAQANPTLLAQAPTGQAALPHAPSTQTASPISMDDTWAQIVQTYAKEDGFDYEALSQHEVHRTQLIVWAEGLAKMDEPKELATWLNIYNGLVVHQIMKNYPIKSVMRVKGFFKARRFLVAGKKRSLDDIENKIIRPRYKDARIHAALNCAAKSCPALHNMAFRPQALEQQLDMLTRAFVNNPKHVKIAPNSLKLSKIFEWFSTDFKRDAGSVRAFLKKYHNDPDSVPRVRPQYIPYNWQLNAIVP